MAPWLSLRGVAFGSPAALFMFFQVRAGYVRIALLLLSFRVGEIFDLLIKVYLVCLFSHRRSLPFLK